MRSAEEYRAIVEGALPDMLPKPMGFGARVTQAARYSVMLGGKRIRPVLTLAACESVCGDYRNALCAACAIECIHTYSLIHDDLPCMDDDDMRRGQPSCHAKYGEATALLAGDGLLTHAFLLLATDALAAGGDARGYLTAIASLAHAAGLHGMVGGQAADIAPDAASGEMLSFIQRNKTAALIGAALTAGAAIGGADMEGGLVYGAYGHHLGVAFQIADDILDATSTPQQLGKTPGKDARDAKLTAVSFYGMEAAERMLLEESQKAAEAILAVGPNGRWFADFALSLAKRTA